MESQREETEKQHAEADTKQPAPSRHTDSDRIVGALQSLQDQLRANEHGSRTSETWQRRVDRLRFRRERRKFYIDITAVIGAIIAAALFFIQDIFLWQTIQDAKVTQADTQLASRISHADNINAENLTADALGQAQSASNVTHSDTQVAIGKADNANGISERTAISNERAWVNPTTTMVEDGLTKGKGIKITAQYVNSGHDPAQNFVPIGRYTTFMRDKWEDGTAAKDMMAWARACLKTHSNATAARSVFPTTGNNYYSMHMDSASPDLKNKILYSDDMENGSQIFVAQGCFLYRSLGKPHHTAFCNFYDKGITKLPSLNICTVGNDAD
jgi:hypothetical protein